MKCSKAKLLERGGYKRMWKRAAEPEREHQKKKRN